MAALFSDLLHTFNTTQTLPSPVVSVQGQTSPGVGTGAASGPNTPLSQGSSDGSGQELAFTRSLSLFSSSASMGMDVDNDNDPRLSFMEDDDTSLSVSSTAHSRDKYQNGARIKARKHGLSSTQSEELMAFCENSPVEMLIDLKIHFMRTENEIITRFIHMFVRHPDFLVRLRHTVAAVLLAPNVPAYVDGVTTQLTKHLEDNAETLLGVPNAQKSDPADWSLIKSSIAVELANMRSAMRMKIEGSIKNQLDIYELTTSLMMYDMRAKKEHWGRFAFLRKCTKIFSKIPAKKRGEYWKFMDKCLLDTRKNARDTYPLPEDVVARKKHETIFIATILDADVKEFALTSGALARTVYTNEGLSNLQFSTEKLVSSFLINGDGGSASTMSCEESPAVEHAEGGSE